MASSTATHVRRGRHESAGLDREQVLTHVFLFAGPVIAFVLAVLFVQ